MTQIKIENPGPVIAADLIALGAAVKLVMAGGSDLSDTEARRAIGGSYHVWRKHGPDIRALAKVLEA